VLASVGFDTESAVSASPAADPSSIPPSRPALSATAVSPGWLGASGAPPPALEEEHARAPEIRARTVKQRRPTQRRYQEFRARTLTLTSDVTGAPTASGRATDTHD
jgi:hypothetical protein